MSAQSVKLSDKPIGYLLYITIVMFFSGTYTGLQSVALYGLVPALFIISILYSRKQKQKGNIEIVLYFTFLILSLLAFFYPNMNSGRFFKDFAMTASSFMCAFIAISFSRSDYLEKFFYYGFVTCILLLILFEYLVGNFNLLTFAAPGGRRDVFLNNANYYSYISLFANFSLFKLHLKLKNRYTTIALILIPILMLIMSFVTQSRSALLFIIVINGGFWYWVVTAEGKSFSKILRVFGLTIVTIIMAIQFVSFYSNSSIKNRVEDSRKDAREILVEEGIEVFMDHPFVGVGMAQFPRYSKLGQFTHNTYVEALAEHGFFIGFLIILIFILPFFKATSLLRSNRKDPLAKLSFLFFFIYLFFNNIFVFYKASPAMMFFFLMIGVQQKLAQKTTIKENKA